MENNSEMYLSEFSSESPFWEMDTDFLWKEYYDPIISYENFPYRTIIEGMQESAAGEALLDREIADFWTEDTAALANKTEDNIESEKVKEINSKARRKKEDITFEMLSKCFRMTINEAAKELKIGITLLKKRCRELNISRWPHRKISSLDNLIHNIKELKKGDGMLAESDVVLGMLEMQRSSIENEPKIELDEKFKRLRQFYFKANYKKRKISSDIDKNDPIEQQT